MQKPARLALTIAAALLVGGAVASEAEAASRFGPGGLGANLHRRFVIRQAVKRTSRGLPVRNRAILWQARPYTRGVITTRRGWRRW
ncbi:MAG: hypothetical protein AAF790_06815 [Planctomycetota bacterium]